MFFGELCTVTHFNTSKSSLLISRPGETGSYKLPLIQQIAHGPVGVRQHFLAIVTSSLRCSYRGLYCVFKYLYKAINNMHVSRFLRHRWRFLAPSLPDRQVQNCRTFMSTLRGEIFLFLNFLDHFFPFFIFNGQ